MGEKFVFIQLRGGMDGLSALRPDDSSVLKQKRPGLLVDNYHNTKAGFAFHPALKNHFELFRNKELSFLHACGLPVQNRSHFRSQDLLETGKMDASSRTGWLAQILEALPDNSEAVSFGSVSPLLLHGTDKTFNWSSPKITDADEKLMRNLCRSLYAGDPELEDMLQQFERLDYLTDGFSRSARSEDPFETIGKMLSKPDGPDYGVISVGNWDTHNDQNRRIAARFSVLDSGLGTLKSSMRPVWDETVIVIVSEFGRSVHENGTNGSDHGTGGVCFVAGGAVMGGLSLGSWPGLKEEVLFEGRDVMPVHDVRQIFACITKAHLGMSHDFIETDLFPEIPAGYKDLNFIHTPRRRFGFV